jgi:hypothetical protein
MRWASRLQTRARATVVHAAVLPGLRRDSLDTNQTKLICMYPYKLCPLGFVIEKIVRIQKLLKRQGPYLWRPLICRTATFLFFYKVFSGLRCCLVPLLPD